MKAIAVFPTKKELALISHPEPALTSPTQAKLRMPRSRRLRHRQGNLCLRIAERPIAIPIIWSSPRIVGGSCRGGTGRFAV